MTAATAMAQTLAAKAPIAIRYIIEAVNQGLDMPLAQGQFLETSLFGAIASTDDTQGRHLGVPREAQGGLEGTLACGIGIVVARFNDFVTGRLLAGAQQALA